LCHRLMVAEAVATGRVTGRNPARRIAERPEVVRRLAAYRGSLADLAAMGLRFEPVTREDVLTAAVDLQKRYGLLTNDSMIAACAERLRVEFLVTLDRSYVAIEELNIVMLDDIEAAG
jgi:predicted nucleic acid-binding protein